MAQKPITQYSDKELEETLSNISVYVEPSHNIVTAEIERRMQQRTLTGFTVLVLLQSLYR